MAEVKWIKLAVDIFDNRKIRQIEILPDGDGMVVIWLKLLCLAGVVNDGGLVYFTKEIPYTEQMLSQYFCRPLPLIKLALKTFCEFGMIEITDDFLQISNWEKYQNIEGLEKVRELNRLRKQKERISKKLLKGNVSRDSHVTVTQCHATDIDKEVDKEVDKEKEEDKKKNKHKNHVDVFQTLISDFTKNQEVQSLLTDFVAMRKAIKKPITDRGLKIALNKLAEMAITDEDRIKIISNAIEHSWQSFYPLKEKDLDGRTQTQKSIDEIREMVAKGDFNIGQN